MLYKALLTDVDRTLLITPDAMPTGKVREAITSTNDTMHIGLATSRPYEKIKDISEYLGLSGPSIVSNGAQVVNVKTGEYYHEYPISPEATHSSCKLLQNDKENIRFWVQDDGTDYDYNEHYTPNKPFVVVAYGMNHTTADRLLPLLAAIEDTFSTKVPSYEPGKVDIMTTSVNATKQHGVKAVADILGIKPHEIIGVGDGYNDRPLLMGCGLKIAMGNAVEELKEIADDIAPSVDDDGLAYVIRKYLMP